MEITLADLYCVTFLHDGNTVYPRSPVKIRMEYQEPYQSHYGGTGFVVSIEDQDDADTAFAELLEEVPDLSASDVLTASQEKIYAINLDAVRITEENKILGYVLADEISDPVGDLKEEISLSSEGSDAQTEESQEETAEAGDRATDDISEESEEIPQSSEEIFESGMYSSRGEDYTVTLNYTEDARIPSDASLEVRELLPGTSEYEQYLTAAKQAMGLGESARLPAGQARFFDITILAADGKTEIQPAAAVSVQITYDEPITVPDTDQMNALHFADEEAEPEILEVQDIQTESRDETAVTAVTFDTESFSVFGIVYTVDFDYTDAQGNVYTYNLAGGTELLLSALFENLHIEADLTGSTARFSDDMPEGLIELSPIYSDDGASIVDWILTSLAPFSTEHNLTVTLSDGSKVVIGVTDDALELPVTGTWENGSSGSGNWSIDTKGLLTITGSGDMSYNANGMYNIADLPWGNYGENHVNYQSSITGLKIGAGITQISPSIVRGCTNLTTVDLSENSSLTRIPHDAFEGCKSLTTITFGAPEKITSIEACAFQNCSALTSFPFGSLTGLTTIINNKTFYNTGLTSIELAGLSSLTKLENRIFGENKSLTSFSLNGNMTITSIDSNVLAGCTALKTIDLSRCTALTSLPVISGLEELNLSGCTSLSGALDLSGITNLKKLDLSGCTGITSVVLPANVEELDLSGCTGLSGTLDLTAYENLNKVRAENCTNLTAVSLSDSVNTIDFAGCSSLTSFTVPQSVTAIPDNAFNGCAALESVTIKNTVTSVGEKAFAECGANGNNTDIIDAVSFEGTRAQWNTLINAIQSGNEPLIEASVETAPINIPYNMENQTKTLAEILGDEYNLDGASVSYDAEIMPGLTVKKEGEVYTLSCTSRFKNPYTVTIRLTDGTIINLSLTNTAETLESGTWEDGTTEKGRWSIDADGVLTITGNGPISQSSTPWKNAANKDKITRTVIENGVTEIGYTAFEGMPHLGIFDLTQCSSITSIGACAFKNSGVEAIVGLKNQAGLTSIGSETFYNATKLACPIDLSGLTSLREIGANAFRSTAITELNMAECGLAVGGITVGDHAFTGCSGLETIALPDSLSFASGATYIFENCKALTTANLPASVSAIPVGLFNGCSKLRTMTVPENYWKSLTTIRDRAFNGCSSLAILPDFSGTSTLKEIGEYAFAGCVNITGVLDMSGIVNQSGTYELVIRNQAFSGAGLSGVTFNGSTALKEIQKYAFENMKAAGSSGYTLESLDFTGCTGLTSLGGGAFKSSVLTDLSLSGCTSLKEFSVSDGVTEGIFSGNGRLKTVDLSGCTALEKLGVHAFTGGALDRIDLTGCDNLRRIDNYAFDGKTNTTILLPDLSHVNYIGDLAFYNDQKITAIDLSNSPITSIGERAFHDCKNLGVVDLSGCNYLTTIGSQAFQNCTSLNAIVIPSGIRCIPSGDSTIPGINNTAFKGDTGIQRLTWDAADYGGTLDPNTFADLTGFKLIIGKDVNTLPEGFFGAMKNADKKDINFSGENWLTIPNNAIYEGGTGSLYATVPESFNGYSEDFYVDDQGVVYHLGERSATVIYCPPTVKEYVAPVSVPKTGNNGSEMLNVTGIASDAFKYASNLSSVWFDSTAISNITDMGNTAFTGCQSLEHVYTYTLEDGNRKKVQDAATIQNAIALFPNGVAGKQPFMYTGLEDTDDRVWKNGTSKGHSDTVLIYGEKIEGKSWVDMKVEIANADNLTGENMTVTFDSSSFTGKVCLYFDFSDPGYIVENSDTLQTITDEAGNTYYYFEREYKTGDTGNKTVTIKYPSPDSAGGTVHVWGEAVPTEASSVAYKYMNSDGKKAVELTASDSYFTASWHKVEQPRYLIKNSASQTIHVVGDGESKDRYYLKGLVWNVSLGKYTTTTDTKLGQNLTKSATFTDTFTFDQGIDWDDEFKTAVDNYISGNSNATAPKLSIITGRDGKHSVQKVFVGSKQYLYIEYPENVIPETLSFSKDASGRIVLNWAIENGTLHNNDTSSWKELPDDSIKLGVMDSALVMKLGTDIEQNIVRIKAGDESYRAATAEDFPLQLEVSNTATADILYSFGADPSVGTHLEDTHTVIAEAGEAKLSLSKTHDRLDETYANHTLYLNEPITFTIHVENDGAQYTENVLSVTDELSKDHEKVLYIQPDQMEEMLDGEYGRYLTITINNALTAGWNGARKNAYGALGDSVPLDDSNSGVLTNGNRGTIVIKKDTGNDGHYLVNDKSYDSIKKALNELNYYVSAEDFYTVQWTFNTETETDGHKEVTGKGTTAFTLFGGMSIDLEIPAAHKSTFQMMNGYFLDTEHRVDNVSDYDPVHYKGAGNWSDFMDNRVSMAVHGTEAGINASMDQAYNYQVSYEASVNKGITTVNGQKISKPTEYNFQYDDVVNFVLNSANRSNTPLENMPVVDEMNGAHVLMVPINGNGHLAERGLTEKDGCYLLDQAGEYNHVKVGTSNGTALIADSITVEVGPGTDAAGMEDATPTTYHTTVKWYFPRLGAGESRKIEYQTNVTAKTKLFGLQNDVFLNDRHFDRLHDSIGGGGASYGFDKKIVIQRGIPVTEEDNTVKYYYNDVLAEHSVIRSEDHKVTYKLTIQYDTDKEWAPETITIKGANLYDRLPQTYGQFSWTKGSNVSVEAFVHNAVLSVNFASDWYINQSSEAGSEKKDNTGRYYLHWKDDASITLHKRGNGDPASTVDIYVTLDFDTQNWDAYSAEAGGKVIDNTAYCEDRSSNVTHEVRGAVSAALRKGVDYIYQIGPTDTRETYFNISGYVEYYVMLYNSGGTRLYLEDLVDTLPEGFTYLGMTRGIGALTNNMASNQIQTYGQQLMNGSNAPVQKIKKGDTYANFLSATVRHESVGEKNGHQIEKFMISGVHYEETNDHYYLMPNEAIAFSYIAKIDEDSSKTRDEATNTVVMDYYDPTGYFNLSLTDFGEGDVFCGTERTGVALNDGSYTIYDSTTGSQLRSDVTVRRGDFKPGLVKEAVSYNGIFGITSGTSIYSNGVKYVTWRVKAKAEDYQSMRGYTITDISPEGTRFHGDVNYVIRNRDDKIVEQIYDSENNYTKPLFKITNTDLTNGRITIITAEDKVVHLESGAETAIPLPTIRKSYYSDNDSLDNQTGKTLKVTITLNKQDDAYVNETLQILVEDTAILPIMPKGYGELTLSTTAEGGGNNYQTLQQGTYLNSAKLTPATPFSRSGDGLKVNENTLLSTATVTITNDGSTSAKKYVKEMNGYTGADHSANKTSSISARNYITLHDARNSFTYTLEVGNENDALHKMVILDNLPQQGDKYPTYDQERGSQFSVFFAEEPDVSVKFQPTGSTEETVTLLQADSDYTVQYSTKASGFTESDLTGANGSGQEWEAWNESKRKDYRSFRVIINKEIPNKHKVLVSFNANAIGKSDSEPVPNPGTIAFNSFAYWYQKKDKDTLHSMSAYTDTVGVRVPYYPELQKVTTDRAGRTVNATVNKDFYFVIFPVNKGYEAEKFVLNTAKSGYSYNGSDTGMDSVIFRKLTVNQGQGSASLQLVPDYSKTNGSGDDLYEYWQDGQKYTVVELFSKDEDTYIHEKAITFEYTDQSQQTVKYLNRDKNWIFRIKKSSSKDNNPLSGAVFAIYGKDDKRKVTEEPANTLDGVTAALTYEEKTNGQTITWYLYAIRKTDNDGVISYGGKDGESLANEEKLKYIELKAPDGYNLPDSGYLTVDINQIEYEQAFSLGQEGETLVYIKAVENTPGYELPSTGGQGTVLFYLLGSILSTVSGILLWRRLRTG